MNRPDIFPINHVVDHGRVVFRTVEGTKLAAAVLEHAAPKPRFASIEPDETTGRRFHVVDPSAWGAPEAAPRRAAPE